MPQATFLGPTLASIAMEQGRAAVCHAFGIPFEGTVDPAPVSAVYGMPEVSGAGLTEEQCREQGLDYEVGRADLGCTPRGAIAGRGGLLKLIFQKEDRKLVGVHCIGDIASEIVGIGQMVIRCGGTLNTIANMSMNTPTYSYAYKYAAFDGLRRIAAAGKESLDESARTTQPDPITICTRPENTPRANGASASIGPGAIRGKPTGIRPRWTIASRR